ncbi:hypothetical protein [Jiulongibacter sediminis]|jgi:hypothetical protein|uniref:hypothetical protein n=1 Tax=Jiulongibacter sediminis TaxID=1605367 RepID=UPI0026ED64D2|nr:hypothetical protein [Jiulongibacter sediminis]
MGVISNQLIINDSLSLKELKQSFKTLYPFLELELYRKGKLLNGRDENKLLGSFSKESLGKGFAIEPAMSINDLEQAFDKKLGLKATVYRKMGSSLIETSFTSAWSLYYQNIKGGELLKDFGTTS